jgi:allantoinase
MSLGDEQVMISECLEVIAKHEGAPPSGWLSPAFSESENTVDLLLVRPLLLTK